MAGFGVRIEGLRETVRGLEALGVETADLKDAFQRASIKVRDEARDIAPARTGKLRGRIQASRTKNKAEVRVSGTEYHRYVYFGSVHNPNPVPFLRIALGAAMPGVEADVLDGVNEAIAKAGLGS